MTQNRVIALFSDEQTTIAAVLSEMGAELAVPENREAKTRAPKQKYFTGRNRLR